MADGKWRMVNDVLRLARTIRHTLYAIRGLQPAPWLWNLGVRMARSFINKEVHEGVVSKAKGPFTGWFRTRDLPAMAEKTFHDRWQEIKRP